MHRSGSTRLTGRLPIMTMVLTLTVLVVGTPISHAVTAPAQSTTTADTFATLINTARTDHGLAGYSVNDELATVARRQAHRMASQKRLFHNPILTTEVTHWRWVGENVGYGPTISALHHAFMNSAPHRANIVDRDFTQVGVGAVRRDGRLWVAEVFRQPAP